MGRAYGCRKLYWWCITYPVGFTVLRQKQRQKSNYNDNQTVNTLHINSFLCETATCIFVIVALRPISSNGLLIHDVSRSNTATHRSRLDLSLPDAQNTTWRHSAVGRTPLSPTHRTPPDTQHSQPTNILASGGIRTHNSSKRAAIVISRYSDIRLYLYKYSTELLYFLLPLKL